MSSINWATPIYIIGLFGLVSYFLKADVGMKKSTRWNAFEAISVTVFIYFAGQLLGGLLAYGIAFLTGRGNDIALDWLQKGVYGQFLNILLIEIFSIGLIYIFIKRRRSSLKSIGLWDRPRWIDMAYVLSGYLVYFVLYLIIVNVVAKFITSVNVDQSQQIGFDTARGLQLVPVFISLVVLPPITEELLMRGFLYTRLRQNIPRVTAVVITSSLFAIAHLQAGSGAALLWIAAVDTFVLSLVLIHLREKTGKLWAPMGLHSLKNFIAFLSLFVFHVAK